MKVYVAGKFEERVRISRFMEELRILGCEITCDWTDHKYSDGAYPQLYCLDDVQGVKDADIYLGIFQFDYNYRGALVEMGIAIGIDIPIWLLGKAIDTCIFSSHPNVKRFRIWDEVTRAIQKYEEEKT